VKNEQQTVGIVTLPAFNELDSFVATRMIDSVPGLTVELVGPESSAVSMAGVDVATPGGWTALSSYTAVIIGSGARTFEHIENDAMMAEITEGLRDDQLLGSQCSGAAIVHRLGRLDGNPVCTDRMTGPKLEALGVPVSFEPFRANGVLASAGGCLSSSYLAYWIIDRLVGREAADRALSFVVPVGEEDEYQRRFDALIPVSVRP
jgi:transcriptional regulator GlxA family with amidase domain